MYLHVLLIFFILLFMLLFFKQISNSCPSFFPFFYKLLSFCLCDSPYCKEVVIKHSQTNIIYIYINKIKMAGVSKHIVNGWLNRPSHFHHHDLSGCFSLFSAICSVWKNLVSSDTEMVYLAQGSGEKMEVRKLYFLMIL